MFKSIRLIAVAAALTLGSAGAMADALPAAAGATAPRVAVTLPACRAGYYRNVSGRCVLKPTHAPSHPKGATAKCRDGTYSFSQHRSGTCSHHRGVAVWY